MAIDAPDPTVTGAAITECPSTTKYSIAVEVTVTDMDSRRAAIRTAKNTAWDNYNQAKDNDVTCPQNCAHTRKVCKKSFSGDPAGRQFAGFTMRPVKQANGKWTAKYEIKMDLLVKCRCRFSNRRIAFIVGGIGIGVAAILAGILISSCSQESEIIKWFC